MVVLLKIAIYSGFTHKKIVIFHSYVKLPEGNQTWQAGQSSGLEHFLMFPNSWDDDPI